jgi:hypothetical protein
MMRAVADHFEHRLFLTTTSRNGYTESVTTPLEALHREERMTKAECKVLPVDDLTKGRAAVEAAVIDKIANFQGGSGKSDEYLRN